jgi:primosomal protein N' (replication factor Y)
MAATGRVCRVLLGSPLPQLDRLFDYVMPERLLPSAAPGVRVKVPLRSAGRVSDGYLVEFADDAGAAEGDFSGALSEVDAVVSPVPVLTSEVRQLARTLADRSAGNASDILRLAIPSRQVRVEKAWLAQERVPPAPDVGNTVRPDVRGYPSGRIAEVVDKGERIALEVIPGLAGLPGGGWAGEWAIVLAVTAVLAFAAGRTAIIAVPDHRDQDQLERVLAELAPPGSVVRFDARQSNADRYRAFLACLDAPRIVVGNRSAVYAPARDLGLIAIWDDGDPLLAEPLAPYVHARDAALVRQQQQGGALIFAGHTRTVEVQRLVDLGWLTEVGPRPRVVPRVIPTASQSDPGQAFERIPSNAWQVARRALEDGPVLVQVARPGHAPTLACANCGRSARCMRCEGPLAVARAGTTPSCRWCGKLATDWQCEHCQHTVLRRTTAGSERTADELGRAFPGVRVVLSDGEHPVLKVDATPALVIATRGAEPLAAGGYRAVLLLDGERMLVRESLRVSDDCLRWWSNAVALGSADATSVLVGVPGALAQTMATWTHQRYARAELADRRRLRLPPAVRIVSVTGAAASVEKAIASLEQGSVLDVLGPTPIEEGLVRAIVRFDYAHGQSVATALRAAVVRHASGRRRPPAGKGGYGRTPTLRVRFDDPEIL